MKVHVWVPEYESATGGIQTFSRFMVRALRDILPEADIRVFAKNDRPSLRRADEPATKRYSYGAYPSWLRTELFAAGLLKHGIADQPDLVLMTHVNFAPIANLLGKLTGTPFWAVGHGIEVWNLPRKSARNSLQKAARLFAVSHFTRERMALAIGCSTSKIEVLPNTVDQRIFKPSVKPPWLLQRYGLTAEQPLILTIGRLAPTEQYKGYDRVLRALPAVRRSFPDVHYLIGGAGPDAARIHELADALGLSQNLTLPGYIADTELCDHYNLCDVFAMPSRGEGFGIVFLEALACGKPVLAGNQDGSVDAVLNGEIGALVNPGSVEEIGQTLCQILSRQHPQETLFYPERLRQRVLEKYGYAAFVEKLRRPIEDLIGGLKPECGSD